MKTFSDLVVGDIIWIIRDFKPIDEVIIEIEKYETGGILLYTLNNDLPIYIPRLGLDRDNKRNYIFVDYNKAELFLRGLRGVLKREIIRLEEKIDELVSRFLYLDSISPPIEFSPTLKRISMGKIKPGDSVWKVQKINLGVERKIVSSVGFNSVRKSLIIRTDTYIFRAYPSSTHSISNDYYTDEKEAWEYMLKWKRSRLETIGRDMEESMCRLEKYEKIWGSERG